MVNNLIRSRFGNILHFLVAITCDIFCIFVPETNTDER